MLFLPDGHAMLMRPKKAETTAVHGCHCPCDMAVCIRKVLATQWVGQSRSQSLRYPCPVSFSPLGHRSVNVRKAWCVPAFREGFSCFLVFSEKGEFKGIQETHIFQRSPFCKRTEIIVYSCVFRSFLAFSQTANAGEFKKTLVFPVFTVG